MAFEFEQAIRGVTLKQKKSIRRKRMDFFASGQALPSLKHYLTIPEVILWNKIYFRVKGFFVRTKLAQIS
jgi:hypothetical protein